MLGRRLLIPSASAASLVALLLLSVACGSADGESAGEGGSGLRVVTTTPLLAEFAARVAGDDAEVSALIPRGVDLHSWQPSTAVARDIAGADVLIVNGFNLEESLLRIVEQNAAEGAPIVVAAAGLEPLEGGHDHADEDHADEDHADEDRADEDHADEDHADEDHADEDHADEDHADEDHADEDHANEEHAEGDPHLWLSVPNAIRYVENIRDALVAADAERAAGYEERAEAFIAELTELDAEIREALSAIPEERRTIVAFHDAYQYLAHEYGLEVVASVAPANPNQETSAQAIAEIVEEVQALGVAAVYKEPQFSAQSLELIAQESGARVLVLRSTLSDDVPTYAEMMRANAASLVDGLGG